MYKILYLPTAEYVIDGSICDIQVLTFKTKQQATDYFKAAKFDHYNASQGKFIFGTLKRHTTIPKYLFEVVKCIE